MSKQQSEPIKIPKRFGGAFNPRSVSMPIAAVSMAIILYAYSVTSIRAAKRNAQLHREADGGQLDMRKESLRRHGVLDPVTGTDGMQLFREAGRETKSESSFLTEKKARGLSSDLQNQNSQNQNEERGGSGGGPASPRTEVEGELESYKGSKTGAAIARFRENNKDNAK